MTTGDLALSFARRLRANADHAERSKFSVCNLSTLKIEEARALADILEAAPARKAGAQEPVAVPAGLWERQAKEAASVIAMIRAMIGEMFGPVASIESAEATLLRGPEATHDGEAILEALGRVRDALAAPVSPPAESGESGDLEEAVRLAEVGEYLFNACRYSGGDGYTEPREMGIDWQWQQSAPEQYGEGMLLAAATKWHDEQAEDGVVTEARKLRSALASTPAPQPADHRRVQDAAPARPELDALFAEAKAQAPQPGGVVKVKALKWVVDGATGGGMAVSEVGTYYAYEIDPSGYCLDRNGRPVTGDICATEEAAKAAAQADYERRILSALEPSPSGWDAVAFEAGAKAMRAVTRALIAAGNKLAFAAETSGGVAGRDDGLRAAIEAWTEARNSLETPQRAEGA